MKPYTNMVIINQSTDDVIFKNISLGNIGPSIDKTKLFPSKKIFL